MRSVVIAALLALALVAGVAAHDCWLGYDAIPRVTATLTSGVAFSPGDNINGIVFVNAHWAFPQRAVVKGEGARRLSRSFL